MAEENSKLEQWSTALKNLVSTLRDAVFFILFLLLLLSPSTIKERLLAAGFTKGNIAGMDWEGLKQSAEETKAAGEVVSKADDHYDELISRLDEMEKSVKDQTIKNSLTKLTVEAKASQAELQSADKAVKQSLSTQQAMVEAVAPSGMSEHGWLFVGKVNDRKDQWAPGSPVAVGATSPTIAIGAKLTLREDTYWRGESPGLHADSPIRSVAKIGSEIVVDSVDYSPSKDSGWFVWINAHRAL